MNKAGWYPDPERGGTFRWWDGTGWTEHRAPMTPAPPVVVPPRRGMSKRGWWIWGSATVVVLAIIVGLAASSADDGNSSPAGSAAASACVRVVDAAREYAAGTRSAASFLSVVKGQESTARAASDSNGRYLPITQAIVSVDTDLSAGRLPTASVGFLASQCGR